MKKLLALVLVAIICCFCVGCGSNAVSNKNSTTPNTPSQSTSVKNDTSSQKDSFLFISLYVIEIGYLLKHPPNLNGNFLE